MEQTVNLYNKDGEIGVAEASERRRTDSFFVYLKCGFVVALLGLMVYCFAFSNITRILNSYDDCGNICAHENSPDVQLECKGADMRDKKFMLLNFTNNFRDPNITYMHKKCVENCDSYPNYIEVINVCFLVNISDNRTEKYIEQFNSTSIFFDELITDLSICWPHILLVCFTSVTFSYLVLFMLRHIVGYVIWGSFIIGIVAFTCISLYVFFVTGDVAAGIFFLCVTLIYLGLLLWIRKLINMVIQLFKEASKTLIDVPIVTLEPILTLVAFIITSLIFFYFGLVIESSGRFEVETYLDEYDKPAKKGIFKSDVLMIMSRWLNVFLYLWFSHFIMGCQHYIIASTVCQWYFTRNKKKLDSPFTKSFKHLTAFHLGSILFGSLILSIVQIIKALITALTRPLQKMNHPIAQIAACLIQALVKIFYEALKFLSKNAYILIAMSGMTFLSAGKRAFKLVTNNIMRICAINTVSGIVFGLFKVFVTLVTIMIGSVVIKDMNGVTHDFIIIAICALFGFLVCHCILTVYEMAVDTIFICFCVDYEANDGQSKPYFMSEGLTEVVKILNENFDLQKGHEDANQLKAV